MERPLRPLVSSPKNVLVLGGTGFVGRHVVPKLVAAGHRVVVPTRRRDRARPLFLLPTCTVVEADIHDRGALARLARGTDALVNLVGILHESGRDTFARAHVELPRNAIAACRDAGVRRLVHMSALNAAPDGPSRYQRSKGEAEALVEASGLDWTIFRPSVIFGRGDSFLSMFAKLVRLMPVVALASADARFQPVWIGDVAHCFATAVDDPRTVGQRYDLCGPAVYTLRELVAKIGAITGHPRPIVPLGPGLSSLQARVLELLPGPLMTRDNLASMTQDNVCDCPFPPLFGIDPAAVEQVAPGYLAPTSIRSPYDDFRAHGGR
jgi:NADH dehydrogenase